MTRNELKALLDSYTDEEFLRREVFDRTPWIFGDEGLYNDWLESVSSSLKLRPASIQIVGSAATGYSLSPLKAGRPFQEIGAARSYFSDVDIAVTDSVLFENAWNTIILFDRRRRLRLSNDHRAKVRLDVYWGAIGQRTVPMNTDPARRLLTIVSLLRSQPPVRGYEVSCRVYRRPEDLQAYHIDSLRQLREELEGSR
jgi:hypothetical protein